MGFLFLPFDRLDDVEKNEKGIPTISKLILKNVMRTINYTSTIPNLKLKVVITYLYKILLSEPDVYGRGIDFSFRLEKFANACCFILNQSFFKSINNDKDEKESTTMLFNKKYNIYQNEKDIKGWEGKQMFYFLTNKKMIEDGLSDSSYKNPNLFDLLLKYFKSNKDKNN